MFHVHLRKAGMLLLLGELFCTWLCRPSWFIVLLKSLLSLLSSCLVVLSLMKVCSTDVSNFYCWTPFLCSILSAFIFMLFGPLLSGAFIFMIVLSSWWSDYFIVIKHQSLPLITIYHEVFSSEVSIATPALF